MKLIYLIIVASLLGSVFASPYEWIDWTNVTGTSSGWFNVSWAVNTNSTYFEYSTLYIKSNETYNQINTCNYNRSITGQEILGCTGTFTPGIYTALISINYGGCSPYSWTPLPDQANCGDVKQFILDIS